MNLFIGFIALVIGIVFIHFNWYISICLTLLFFILILYKRNKKYLIVALSFFTIGVGSSSLTTYIGQNVDEVNGTFIVTTAKENYYIISNYVSKFYVYERDNPINAGDIIYFEGKTDKLEFVTLESEFNFTEYLQNLGVYKELKVTKKSTVLNSFSKNKEYQERMKGNLSDEYYDIFRIIFYGEYNTELRENFINLNLIYVLGASGIFINLIINLFNIHLRRFTSEKVAFVFTFLLIVPFYLVNIFHFSIFRVVTLYFLTNVNKHYLKNKFSRLTIISSFAISCLLVNPHLLFSTSFILGFTISFLNFFTRKYINSFGKYRRNFIRRLLVYLFTLPITIYMTSRFNIFGFLIQILMMPIIEATYVVSFVSFLFGYVPILKYLFLILDQTSKFLSRYSIVVYFPKISESFFVVIIIFEILTFILLTLKNKKVYKLLTSIWLFCFILLIFPYRSTFASTVTFLNIGQGDSILIQDRFTNVLVDTGGNVYKDIATSSLIPYFVKNKIYKIDCVFISHLDYDHYGALESLEKNFKVGKVIIGNDFSETKVGNLVFKNLNQNKTDGDKNEGSQVLSLNFKGDDYLFMGDAPISVENEIMKNYPNLKCKYLKCGHHGSSTSSSYDFLKFLQPEEAIISCGKNNKYGHPNDVVINNLNKLNIKIRRTDLEGSIMYTYF